MLKVDIESLSSYVRLGVEPVARTQSLDHLVNVDFDAYGNVVGVEFLCIVTTDNDL